MVGGCSGRWSVFSQPCVGGGSFLRSVVGGRLFLRKWTVVGGSVTVVGGLWLVAGRWAVLSYYVFVRQNLGRVRLLVCSCFRRETMIVSDQIHATARRYKIVQLFQNERSVLMIRI